MGGCHEGGSRSSCWRRASTSRRSPSSAAFSSAKAGLVFAWVRSGSGSGLGLGLGLALGLGLGFGLGLRLEVVVQRVEELTVTLTPTLNLTLTVTLTLTLALTWKLLRSASRSCCVSSGVPPSSPLFTW